MMNNSKKHLDYFNSIATKIISYRKRRSYYWSDITKQCTYFINPGQNVLEIGCGAGNLLGALTANQKVGIDFSPTMIDLAKTQYPEIEFHEMSAEKIVLSQKFDVIILSNTIGFLNDIQAVLEQLQKVSHSNTKVIITYYNYLWQPLIKLCEFIGVKQKTPQQNWLSQTDIKNLLHLAGFDMYRKSKSMLLPINIPLFSNIVNKYLSQLPIFNYFALNTYCIAKTNESAIKNTTEADQKYSVSIVVPARNESGNIENAILRTPKFGSFLEFIFIEGNSTDDTWEKIQEVSQKYSQSHKIKIGQQDGKGKGNAVRKGFDMATGDILMILDADLTVPPEDLPKFYNALVTGKGEFINGSRLVYTMEKQAMRFLNVLGNKFFSMAFTWLLEQPFKDTLCCTKVLFRRDYENIKKNRSYFGDFDPFGDFDLIFGAHKLNLKITELPIRYQERTYGSTNISRFKHGFILLKMCLFAARKIRFR